VGFFGVLVGADGVVVRFVVVASFVVGCCCVMSLGSFFVMFRGFLVSFVCHDDLLYFRGFRMKEMLGRSMFQRHEREVN
jgi:hypothetical protein